MVSICSTQQLYDFLAIWVYPGGKWKKQCSMCDSHPHLVKVVPCLPVSESPSPRSATETGQREQELQFKRVERLPICNHFMSSI